MPKFQPMLIGDFSIILLLLLSAPALLADSWRPPHDSTNRSDNGEYEFVIIPKYLGSGGVPSGTLRHKENGNWTNLWERELVNRIAPVSAMVPDSGRYVVTFDEWHSVGEKPVVAYSNGGCLVAELTLEDLKLNDHPNITRSVSSYWWNAYAIFLFGPPSAPGPESWRRLLENSLFIRLYWGEVIAIDLASGKVRDREWWGSRPSSESRALRQASDKYVESAWRRLAGEYFRPENFEPDPSQKGIKGILLAGQLKTKDALGLLHKIAATDRFKHWAAPPWKTTRADANVLNLAKTAIAEIERD